MQSFTQRSALDNQEAHTDASTDTATNVVVVGWREMTSVLHRWSKPASINHTLFSTSSSITIAFTHTERQRVSSTQRYRWQIARQSHAVYCYTLHQQRTSTIVKSTNNNGIRLQRRQTQNALSLRTGCSRPPQSSVFLRYYHLRIKASLRNAPCPSVITVHAISATTIELLWQL